MGYEEFRDGIQNKRNQSEAKIRNSWGVYDVYKYLRRNQWFDIGRPLKEHEFYTIIRGVNDLLADEIAIGNKVSFPHHMGVLELRKLESGVSIVNGRLRNTYPVNWDKTVRLWYEDEEARRDKVLIRNEQQYTYHVRYNKWTANYENKCFYQFALNRFIKIRLKENIENGTIKDTLW